jgi:PiT family inorganic phosphate transporter
LYIVVILAALAYSLINGFHDGGNVFATTVSSRAVTPAKALLTACAAELFFPIIGGTTVAATIGKGVIKGQTLTDADVNIALMVILCALLGAIFWNIITWRFGLPSSSSHALIGGLIGSGVGAFGSVSIEWNILLGKIILVLFLTPVIGFVVGFLIMRLTGKLLQKFNLKVNKVIKNLNFLSIILLAGSHGVADAQKTMGIITLVLLVAQKIPSFGVPLGVKIISSAMLSLGLFFSGWKIIATVGSGIYKMEARHALNVQFSSAMVIYVSAALGGAVSTSQVVSSTIMGVGSAERFKAVNWDVAKNILLSWIMTLPASAALSMAFFLIGKLLYSIS